MAYRGCLEEHKCVMQNMSLLTSPLDPIIPLGSDDVEHACRSSQQCACHRDARLCHLTSAK